MHTSPAPISRDIALREQWFHSRGALGDSGGKIVLTVHNVLTVREQEDVRGAEGGIEVRECGQKPQDARVQKHEVDKPLKNLLTIVRRTHNDRARQHKSVGPSVRRYTF